MTEGVPEIDAERVREYLDHAIGEWRKIALRPTHPHNRIAIYYVDAYQSARVSLLGSALP